MSTVLNTKNLRYLPVVNRLYDDAVMLPVTGLIDFSVDNSFVLDLSTIPQTQKLINQIQAVFVHAPLAVSDQFAVQVTAGGPFSFRVKPPANGWIPLPLIRNQYVITLVNTSQVLEPSAAPLNLFFVNYPVEPFTQNIDPLTASGTNNVTVVNTPLNVIPVVYSNTSGSAALNAAQFIGNQTLLSVLSTATPKTLITAPAGWGYYITGFVVQPQAQANFAALGVLEVFLSDSAFGNLFFPVWAIPASGGIQNNPPFLSPPGFFWNSKTAGSSFQAALSSALTLGTVRISVNYGFTPALLGY